MAGIGDFDLEATIFDDIAVAHDDPDAAAAGPGGISLALTPATVTVTAQAQGITAEAPPTIPTVVTNRRRHPRVRYRRVSWFNVTAVSPAGDQSIALTPDSITVTAQAQGITAGGAPTPPTVIKRRRRFRKKPRGRVVWFNLLAAPEGISLALTPATVTVTPQAMGRTVGGVSVALSKATITVTPKAQGITPGAVSRAISPATITVTAIANGISLTGGGHQTLGLLPATITVTAKTLGLAGIEPEPEPTPVEELVGGGRRPYSLHIDQLRREDDELLVLL